LPDEIPATIVLSERQGVMLVRYADVMAQKRGVSIMTAYQDLLPIMLVHWYREQGWWRFMVS